MAIEKSNGAYWANVARVIGEQPWQAVQHLAGQASCLLWGGLPTDCCGVVSRPTHLSDEEVCDVEISVIGGRVGGSGDRPQLE